MIVELIRLETGRSGTFGILKLNKQVFCCTLEPPDKENKQNISSIPTGQYDMVKHVSPTHGETFMVEGVTDRNFILFHSGNKVDHTEGCVLLGASFGKLSGDRAVLNSGKTFAAFMSEMLGHAAWHLTISEVY